MTRCNENSKHVVAQVRPLIVAIFTAAQRNLLLLRLAMAHAISSDRSWPVVEVKVNLH